MQNIDLLITLTRNKNDENNVTLAFSMGIKALEKGYDVELLLLSYAVNLAEKNYADSIDIGAPFDAVKDLIPLFLEKGGKLKVCKACMIHNGVQEDNLIAGADIIEADYVVDALMNSKKTFQLN